MQLIRIDAYPALDDAIERSYDEPVVLYKHSATCSLSYVAREEMLRLAREGGPPVFEIIVQFDRPLSNAVAEAYGIRHESPQVIVIHQNRSVFDASHHRVTAQAVLAATRSLPRQKAA